MDATARTDGTVDGSSDGTVARNTRGTGASSADGIAVSGTGETGVGSAGERIVAGIADGSDGADRFVRGGIGATAAGSAGGTVRRGTGRDTVGKAAGYVAVNAGGTVAGAADAIVAGRLRAAAAIEPLPGEANGRTAAELAANLAADSPYAVRFTEEVAAAVRGTALALEAAVPHPDDLWAAAAAAHTDPSVWFEQAVLLGHPTHPLARSRGELTDHEIRAYAPEHQARFDLGRYRIPHTTFAAGMRMDLGRAGLLPVHPWQARRRSLGEPDAVWTDAAPLMSLRTISIGDCHVKTAVDLQLTSAVRHVSPAAAANGQDVVAHLGRVAYDHGITLLPESACLPVTADGGPDSGLAAILRPTPAAVGHPRAVPLAALAEPCPATGRPIAAALAGESLAQWWTDFMDIALAPVRLFANTGAALEAHGQNTLVSFDGDRPAELVYRDFGGIRVPKTDWPVLEGDIQTDDAEERLRKLTAALFPTTLTSIVDALATWTGTEPGPWWRTVDHALADIGAPAAEQIRTAPWPIKATTAMRLAADPTADIWARVDNPLAAA